MSRQWDVIVLGLGAMGSAALWQLAQRGARVLGIEQFSRGHDRGSSHGDSRIIRYAYFEHPDYVPLLRRSGALWRELETSSRVKLLHECGVLYGGLRGSEVIEGVKRSARMHGLQLDSIAPTLIGSRFPAFARCQEPIDEFVFEPHAGFVRPELAIRAMLSQAESHGASVRESTQVTAWRELPEWVEVDAAGTTERASALVLCAGAWTNGIAQSVDVSLVNTRQVIGWITPQIRTRGDERELPAFFLERQGGAPLYGIPMASDQSAPLGIKVGLHGDGEPCDPNALDRVVRPDEFTLIEEAFARAAPGAAGSMTDSAVCMYTNTDDGHFVIDKMPGSERVSIGCGFCGHGFKFAPVVGEILADLATHGEMRHDVGFLRRQRFSKT